MKYTAIIVTESPNLTTITLNRPDRKNAMTPEMQSELLDAIKEVGASADCRVLILRGAGDAFCSGLDLNTLQTLPSRAADDHRADAERVATIFRTLYELPIPTIAAVHGPAIAGGTGLATICDFTLAVPSAKFGYTEARIGFVPALVSAFLALQLGDKRSRDLLLTGRLFDAAEARRLGLVNEIVEPENLSAHVDALAQRLIANSPASLAATKRLLSAQNKQWLDAAIANALDANEVARKTADFHEGITAFIEKRKPIWKR
ncbi:MAG: enoyl-CoA hydratase/isomerase family protein [Acidobacteriaceae bacterium]